PKARHRARGQSRRLDVHRLLHRRRRDRLRQRQEIGHRALRQVLPRHARRRRLSRAVAVRGGVRLPGPRRARHRAHARRRRRRLRLALVTPRALTLVVALVVAAAWVPSLRNGFVWDDQYDILRSDRLHHARAIGDVFVHHAMWSADQPETAIATYRPLALATLAVDYQVWKLRPAGYHATNVLLHVLATLAVLLALATLVGDWGWAAALALLFALHPANAEAVAWINGRSEMLALGCGALAVWAAATRRAFVLGLMLLLA